MRSILPPGLGRLGQRRLAAIAQKMALRVLTNEQSQFNPRQPGQQLVEPERRAFTTRRQITATSPARITIAHGNDCDARFIMECLLVHAHPRAQALPAQVIPRNAGRVHACTGRLPHDEDAGRFTRTQHRTRAERQMRLAGKAIAHGGQQRCQGGIACFWHCDLFLSAARGVGRLKDAKRTDGPASLRFDHVVVRNNSRGAMLGHGTHPATTAARRASETAPSSMARYALQARARERARAPSAGATPSAAPASTGPSAMPSATPRPLQPTQVITPSASACMCGNLSTVMLNWPCQTEAWCACLAPL